MRTLRVRPAPPGAGTVVNAPVMVRTQFSTDPTLKVKGLGGMPGPNGGPGSPLYPYQETGDVYNPASAPSGTAAGAMQSGGASTPLGSSAIDWNNPTTYSTIPLTNANLLVNTSQPILSLNFKRNSLIIQNTSTATLPDVAPTIYIGFNAQPVAPFALALPPGFGFFWSASDTPPRDSIYVVAGPFNNGGATVQISGCVIQGTYTPAS